jgi:hypothetical protein
VLDLRHVGTIDETGAAALQRLGVRLQRRGIDLLLAGLAGGSAQAQALQSFGDIGSRWPDADRAVEAAERRLLGEATIPEALPLAACALLQGLDAAQCACVAARMRVRELAAGEALFAEGDAGDCLYVLTRGSVSIVSRVDAAGRSQRYLSMSPGITFGETAMLDGLGRSAGAVADTAATVHALAQSELDALLREQPELAALLYRNLAVHLSQRLRSAAAAWHVSTR